MAFQKTASHKHLDEVRFANHIYEFLRFYRNQKSLNDEIAGLVQVIHFHKGDEKRYFITKNNFLTGIKRLYGFVIDNLHYVNSYNDAKSVLEKVENLEKEYLGDKKYQELLSNDSKGYEEEVKQTLMYLKYVIKSFRIANIMCNLLQNSLMLGTRDIKKHVSYFNEREFFEHLSRYRDEVSSELSNFKLINLFDHFKKILSYYYTYRILLIKDERELLDEIVEDCIDLITDEKVAEVIIRLKNGYSVGQEESHELKEWTLRLRKILATIYYSTNKELSNRNVLPKIHRRIFIDNSLI